MSSNIRSRNAGQIYAVRLPLIAAGLLAILWSAATLPAFLQNASRAYVAAHIIMGDDFHSRVLNNLAQSNGVAPPYVPPYPSALHDMAIIRLRLAERLLIGGDQTRVRAAFSSLDHSLVQALNYMPTDSFLWLALFWSRNTNAGFRPENQELLKMSYLCGPREGWIAARRSRFAIALFPQLSPDLRAAALTEFKNLAASNYIDTAAKILVGPGWNMRDTLLKALSGNSKESRESLIAKVGQLGYDLKMPPNAPGGDTRPGNDRK